jgi:hypothetical protein
VGVGGGETDTATESTPIPTYTGSGKVSVYDNPSTSPAEMENAPVPDDDFAVNCAVNKLGPLGFEFGASITI